MVARAMAGAQVFRVWGWSGEGEMVGHSPEAQIARARFRANMEQLERF